VTDIDPEGFRRLTHEIAKVGERDVKAFRDKDRVILVIQNAPEELRKLADALEKASITEIQALVAFQEPKPGERPAPKKAPPDGPKRSEGA
jgi:hypothetical protein